MARSGTAPAPSGSKPLNPSNPQPGLSGAVPDLAIPFKAWGLRKTAQGYELTEVSVDALGAAHCRPVRQAEPQKAIAYAYLEAAVDQAYLEDGR